MKPSHSFRRWFQLDCSLNFYFSRVKLHDILGDLKVISFSAARQNRLSWKAVKRFDYDVDKAGILSWHYKQFLKLENEKDEDARTGKCRYCNSTSGRCKCHDGLKMWWKAARILALLMPSSGAAERVFSLLNNLFSDQQTLALGDLIFLSLFLAYNKRKV